MSAKPIARLCAAKVLKKMYMCKKKLYFYQHRLHFLCNFKDLGALRGQHKMQINKYCEQYFQKRLIYLLNLP